MRRYDTEVREEEDVTGLAGWMYSDLLLGLMVVFLATISFIPGGDRQPNEQRVAYAYARVHAVDFEKAYARFDADLVAADIADFKLAQGLPTSAYVTKARFVGTYNGATETNRDGMDRALAFSNNMTAANPNTLKYAATTVRAVRASATPQVLVKFTFASEVQVVAAP